jgi:hypothetical protein
MKKLLVHMFVSVQLVAVAQDHGHLNVGAVGTNQNDALTFDNAAIFEVAADYVKTLTFTNGSTYAGYYQGNITLTALAATEAHAGPEPNAPALGSQIFAQLVSVDGPTGGAFAFWDTGATNPTISRACGTTGTNTFVLSQNGGLPGSDPYGHIHGRRFTATVPGIYNVGFRAFDVSTNGVGGGPIHSPSDVIKMYFQAGDNIHFIEPDVDHTHVTFGARAGYSWQLQAATMLNPPDWQAIGAPVTGDDYFHEVEDDNPVAGLRYFRVKGAPLAP